MKEREDLAICDCGREFLAVIRMPSFANMHADRPCPGCGYVNRVHQVVYDVWWARLLHWLEKFGIKRRPH